MGSKSIKGMKSIKFYRDFNTSNTMKMEQQEVLKKKIKVSAQIASPESFANYSIRVSDLRNNLLSTSSQTSNGGQNIVFSEFLVMEYFFEKEQPIKIQIVKNGYNYKNFQTSVGSIFGSRNSTLNQKFPNIQESVLITSEPLSDTNDYLYLRFQCANFKDVDFQDEKKSCYYLLSSSKVKIYQSEPMSDKGNFDDTHIPCNLLNNQIKIDFYNHSKKLVHSISATVAEFTDPKGAYSQIRFQLRKNCEIVFKNNSRALKDYWFLDYVKAGVRLGLDIAIDFTDSNGHPLKPDSLHRIKEGFQNDYEKAIRACGNIVGQYDYDQMFPVWGFGAKIREDTQASMCFNITLTEDPYIHGINEIINEYHKVLNNITFHGPTYFTPIIRQVINMIRSEENPLDYHILMILTDGVINDMNQTIDALVEGSFLPLSVIIIGIGKADFSNMNILDADDDPLVDSRGRMSARDLVQFVPYNDYKNDSVELAAQVLEEIPRQIVEFYTQNNMFPDSMGK